jgi:hypothetical protein
VGTEQGGGLACHGHLLLRRVPATQEIASVIMGGAISMTGVGTRGDSSIASPGSMPAHDRQIAQPTGRHAVIRPQAMRVVVCVRVVCPVSYGVCVFEGAAVVEACQGARQDVL